MLYVVHRNLWDWQSMIYGFYFSLKIYSARKACFETTNIVAAFICRSGGERFKSFGNYRVLDTHTGKVHEVE